MRHKAFKGKLERDFANAARNEKLADIFSRLKFSRGWTNKKLSEITELSEGQLTKLIGSRSINFQEYHLEALEKAFGVVIDRESLEIKRGGE